MRRTDKTSKKVKASRRGTRKKTRHLSKTRFDESAVIHQNIYAVEPYVEMKVGDTDV